MSSHLPQAKKSECPNCEKLSNCYKELADRDNLLTTSAELNAYYENDLADLRQQIDALAYENAILRVYRRKHWILIVSAVMLLGAIALNVSP